MRLPKFTKLRIMKQQIAAVINLFIYYVLSSPTSSCPSPHLIDLGYAKHVPTYINETDSGQRVAIYKNIRFASPPTGDLRFRKPDTDLAVESGIQDGRDRLDNSTCISTAPWMVPFPEINGTTYGGEDCLFLDVYVPEGVRPGDNVPVLHWFVGSAYAFGSKEFLTDPMGIFDQMHLTGKDKFIFVSNNYRLGISGFMYSRGEDMDANVGLFDCLAAAEWTSKYISKFGGDSSRATAMGESAGASILYYMSTLGEGHAKLPFQQMFVASPAAPPRRNVEARQRDVFKTVLEAANCSSIGCLRGLSEDDLANLNHRMINDTETESGGGNFGPGIGFSVMPGGKDLPDIPLQILRDGNVNSGLKRVIVGSMANEGLTTSSDADMPAQFPKLVRRMLPNASDETIAKIQAQYHPKVPEQLAWDWVTDVVFACQSYNLANGMADRARLFINSFPPAFHGQDVSYYFYMNQEWTPVDYPDVAREYQSKLLDFIHGEEMDWPVYGSEKKMYNVSSRFDEMVMPKELQERCDLINEIVLDPVNGA